MPRAPPPPLVPCRMEVVEKAWGVVSRDAESITLEQLRSAYDASQHPRVLDGNLSVLRAEEALMRHFEAVEGGIVRWAQFLAYHVKVSNEVDASRSLDRDSTFIDVVVRAWRLNKDPHTALSPSGIIPITLECPTGLAATKNMDLVWPLSATETATSPTLGIFRGVVKCRFARALLPSHIRGCFAFPDELQGYNTVAPVSRSALVAPLSIVWTDIHDGNELVYGLKDVVAPNVDVEALPDYLKSALLQSVFAEKKYNKIIWLPLEHISNPMYKKSSEAFGIDAQEHAEHVLRLKKKVYEGTGCGLSWYGHTGKFTDTFYGGPYRSTGLNTSVVKPVYPTE